MGIIIQGIVVFTAHIDWRADYAMRMTIWYIVIHNEQCDIDDHDYTAQDTPIPGWKAGNPSPEQKWEDPYGNQP